jgi:exodeoxyribonuclease VII small subunit
MVDEATAKPPAKHRDIAAMSFEKALRELESIVGRLERGDVELEESISIYERGEALKEHCDRLLRQAEAKVEKQAEAKVEKLTFDNGEPSGKEPFKAQD